MVMSDQLKVSAVLRWGRSTSYLLDSLCWLQIWCGYSLTLLKAELDSDSLTIVTELRRTLHKFILISYLRYGSDQKLSGLNV